MIVADVVGKTAQDRPDENAQSCDNSPDEARRAVPNIGNRTTQARDGR
jgi:hypothetical protein